MRRAVIATLFAGTLLGACASIEPEPVLTRKGISKAARDQALSHGPIYNFVRAEEFARPYKAVANGSGAGIERVDVEADATSEMLETGFTAVYASCSDFFQSSGKDQTRLLVLRDIIVMLSSLAGGALAIIDRDGADVGQGNENVLAGIALGTTATLSGIDIYTERFLFGAENIDSVRELTLKALDAHRTRVLERPPLTYERVVVHLMDHQAICTTRRIAMMARKAIAEGEIEASRQDEGSTELTRRRDEATLDQLGQVVGVPRGLTPDQAGALWWLLFAGPESEAELQEINEKLEELPNGPFDGASNRRSPWASETSVRKLIRAFSAETLAAFEKALEDKRKAAGAAPPPPPPPPPTSGEAFVPAAPLDPAAPADFSLGAPTVDTGDSRVSVDVSDGPR